MEEEEGEEEKNSRPVSPTLTLILTLGVGVGVLSLARPQSLAPLKPLSAVVKLSHAALSASRHPHTTLLFASKALLKLHPSAPASPPSNRLKACAAAALSLARCAHPDHALAIRAVKLCKNFLSVAEGFYGLRLDSGIKNGLKTASVVVKAAAVVAEVERRLLVAEWERRRLGQRRVRFSGDRKSRYGVQLRCSYVPGFDGCRGDQRCFVDCFSINEKDEDVRMKMDELLMLGISMSEERMICMT